MDRVDVARFVLRWASDLVRPVMNGSETLDGALEEARKRERQANPDKAEMAQTSLHRAIEAVIADLRLRPDEASEARARGEGLLAEGKPLSSVASWLRLHFQQKWQREAETKNFKGTQASNDRYLVVPMYHSGATGGTTRAWIPPPAADPESSTVPAAPEPSSQLDTSPGGGPVPEGLKQLRTEPLPEVDQAAVALAALKALPSREKRFVVMQEFAASLDIDERLALGELFLNSRSVIC
jgi:hypothetical protein